MLDTRGPHRIALCTCGQEAKRNNEVGCRVHGLHTILLCSQVSWVDITSSFLPMILRRLQHLEPTLATHSRAAALGWHHLPPRRCLAATAGSVQFSSVQSLSRVQLSVTPWTAAHQASLSIANSWSLLRLTSIESVMPANHLILCPPLLLLPSVFPSIRVFSMSQFFTSGGQSIGVSASASVLPINTQDLFPLRWTGWISLQSKGLSGVFSNTTVQKHQFFCAQLSL